MTRTCSPFLVILAAAGCFSLPPSWPSGKPGEPAPTSAAVKPLKPEPVTPDQVNELNAREKAKALRDEMDRDAQAQSQPLTAADAQALKDAHDNGGK